MPLHITSGACSDCGTAVAGEHYSMILACPSCGRSGYVCQHCRSKPCPKCFGQRLDSWSTPERPRELNVLYLKSGLPGSPASGMAIDSQPSLQLDPSKFTLNDLHLAGVYWPQLKQLAVQNQGRSGAPALVEYGRLVAAAKLSHPSDPVVQSAIPTSIGRKLDPINWFCKKHGLPNLTCQAVNAQGKPGSTYMRSANWEAELHAVANFDWAGCSVEFDAYLATTREKRKEQQRHGRRARPEAEAGQDWWKWWEANRALVRRPTHDEKTRIIEFIREWIEPGEAYAAVTGLESPGA